MDDERDKLLYILGMGTQFGFMVALTLAGLLVLGVYLDRTFDAKPVFTILGVVLGFAGTGAEIRYVVLPFLEKKDKSNKQTKGQNNKKNN